MATVRSTISVLNAGIQSFVKSSGSILGGASARLAGYLEVENEIFDQTRIVDIEQRVTSRIEEFYEFETAMHEKHGAEGIERINQLREAFKAKAEARK